jgi:TnpA family transposase
LESLRREIHEGLNVVENWNSANAFILYGKGGEFASNTREEQEVGMLALHLLQISLVYINTLMIQQVLAEPTWQGRLTITDLRALTPLSTTTRLHSRRGTSAMRRLRCERYAAWFLCC